MGQKSPLNTPMQFYAGNRLHGAQKLPSLQMAPVHPIECKGNGTFR